jgi:glutathione S-transferase
MVLIKKGVSYEVKPTSPSNKPSWLIEKHEGKMPVIVHKGQSMTDSMAIAEYLEKTFPHSSLTRQGAYSYQEVLEKTANFFPSVRAAIINKDASKDLELLSVVEAELDQLDEIIRSTPGRFICGIEQTLADFYLGPQLFHALVALEHFKGYDFYHLDAEPTRPALENYIERFLSSEEFNDKRAYYSVDQVVYGWKVARGEAKP